MSRIVAVLAVMAIAIGLSGCIEVDQPTAQPASRSAGPVGVSTLERVAATVMPVAERECRARQGNGNCDYRVVLDQNPGAAPNAYQSMAKDGRPQITVTLSLLQDLRNQDELAFILGHESAHYILGHIQRTTTDATVGAVLGGVLAGVLGADVGTVDTAQRVGATVGGRAYSKRYELEADQLGAIIAERAGYDAVRGAQYFNRAPDPGNAFLGSHPPNAERIETVRRTVQGY